MNRLKDLWGGQDAINRVAFIAAIAAYFGYNVKGGALEVGKASTNAVVMSSIMILLADVILTQLMLT